MNATTPAPTGVSPALAAFLRGSGRRALLFAQLQCGDAIGGDAAAISALPRFAETAAALPMAQWPRRFWSGLLAEPGLRQAADAHWPAGFAALAGPGPGARAALLLWLVAGLGEEDAAAAMGVSVPAWQQAVQRAAPRDAEGKLDAAAWRALEAEVRDALRGLAPERIAAWDQACARLASPMPLPVRKRGERQAATRARRWLLPALALCLVVLAASYLVPGRPGLGALIGGGGDAARLGAVQRRPLPQREAPPAFEAGGDANLLLHPDFDLLLAGGDTPLLRDLPLDAWYAANRPAPEPSGGEETDAE